MSARRRHANDFTDALTSFRQINDEESSQTTSQTISEDDLLSTRSKLYENDKDTKSKKTRAGSIILAGNLTNQQCISSSDSYNTSEKDTCSNRQPLLKDISIVSEESSYRTIKADLNKRINLFDNEYLDRECSSIEEQSNLHTTVPKTTDSKNIKFCHLNKNKAVRQCDSINNRRRSMSESSLENVTSCDKKLGKSKSYGTLNTMLKRDTNYNIKANQILPHSTKMTPKVSHHEKVEMIVLSFNALSLSKPSILSNKKDDCHYIKDQKHDSTSEESLKEDLDPSELKTFLHWLADKKPLKEAQKKHKPQTPFLRRLSTNYYNSPKAFTEGLLTIIEESVINNDSRASLQCSEISSYKFNEELKKMCKLIEDETIPEWPQSPNILTPTCTRRKSQESKSDPLCKFHTLSPGLYSTPTFSRRNSKDSKKIYRRMSKNIKKSLHDSTSTFESLEAYCEKLYPNEYKATLQDKSQSPLKKNMDNILRACDNQMASLDDSLNINEQIEKARTCFSNPDEYNNTPEAQHDLFSGEKYDRINSKRLSDVFKQRTKYSKDKMFELDDLENTLMYEIAKKRQRCLDTARIMMDIDSESTETQETQETYPNIEYTSKFTNDDKFLKTLMYLKKYQNSLEKYKPLLNQFHQIKSCSPRMPYNKKNIRTTLISDENLGAHALSTLSGDKRILRTPKFSRKKIATPSSTKHSINKPVVSKPRLFVTPGKSPVNKGCKPKRTYFPDMPETKQNKPEVNSHAQSIYRQIGNYDHVISPIALYIKGIDSPVKNLKPKTNEIPLTPKKKRFLRSPSPKFQLSPKRPRDKLIGMAVKNKNIADNNCTHSKVHYKLPSHIKKIGNRKVGNRINGCSTKDKVAIQHEGLTKSVQMDYLKPTETYCGSAEEFVYTE
ncbi:uncharacterized protein LOC105434367 [Pogonomyrmex barbatus]|uniref:Uncharacterized protein LOC105434367 n=1 Tax=Pogonomyrmex barbatus TaxID=144034 RepID=A0A6I9WVN3_9HYME|nr:uncharacterized protein LOC105434367 [Pogonomyrmex barbatus]